MDVTEIWFGHQLGTAHQRAPGPGRYYIEQVVATENSRHVRPYFLYCLAQCDCPRFLVQRLAVAFDLLLQLAFSFLVRYAHVALLISLARYESFHKSFH